MGYARIPPSESCQMIRVIITFVLMFIAGGVLIVEFGLGRM